MGEPRGTVRTTISIPPQLKQEMEAEEEGVNWSAVATEAFRHKLLELQSSRKGATMNDVIQRLKAAAELEEDENYTAGKRAGEAWAKEEARPSQLRRMQVKYDSDESFRGEPDGFGWAGVVYWLVNGEHHGDRTEISGFW